MNKQNVIGAIAVIALILGAIALLRAPAKDVAAVFGNVVGGTTSPTGVILPNPSVFDFLESRVALLADSQFMEGGATVTTGIDETSSIGSCAGTATSTQFAVANPFAATSTATVFIENAQNSASSTVFKVGTSTSAFPNNTASNLSPTLVNATIASSSLVSIFSGVTAGSAQSSGSGTFQEISVGPSEFVDGYATSTFSTGIQVGIPSCTYKIQWDI